MTKTSALLIIKLVHTLVWLFYSVVIFYMLYEVATDQIDHWLWIGYALVIFEVLVLLYFRFFCPLTILARKYSSSTKDNFDIFLPNWLAKNNKLIYTSIMVVILIFTIYRLM